jgi:hypothetical protein
VPKLNVQIVSTITGKQITELGTQQDPFTLKI